MQESNDRVPLERNHCI